MLSFILVLLKKQNPDKSALHIYIFGIVLIQEGFVLEKQIKLYSIVIALVWNYKTALWRLVVAIFVGIVHKFRRYY